MTLRGPEGNGWPQLGGSSLVDYLAGLSRAPSDGIATVTPGDETRVKKAPAKEAPAKKAPAKKAPAKKATAKKVPAAKKRT